MLIGERCKSHLVKLRARCRACTCRVLMGVCRSLHFSFSLTSSYRMNYTSDEGSEAEVIDEIDDETQCTSQPQSETEFWSDARFPAQTVARDTQGFMTQTAFDAYFLNASKPSRTSSNVFSDLVAPLSVEEFAEVIKRVSTEVKESGKVLWQDETTRKTYFSQYFTELQEGFNLLFYGYGSKRDVLNSFAKTISARKGHVVVVNGFHPDFAFKDLLNAIEQIPAFQDILNTGASSVEAQTQRIYDFFLPPSDESHPTRDLYLVVHNIEGPAFRKGKAKSCLSLLALNPRIHIIASVDHINAHLRWTFGEVFARKTALSNSSKGLGGTKVPRKGFAWLWHDLTTLAPYDFELAYADPTSIAGASAIRGGRARADAIGAQGMSGGFVNETAARHILASVTQKARKLFILLGTKQLEIMADEANANASAAAPPESAYDYNRLFNAARDNFIATNDTALRSLLSEFKDHALVVSTSSGTATETLWIAMRKDALAKIIAEVRQQES